MEGFNHYGYKFEFDRERRIWVLRWYTEDSHEDRSTLAMNPADGVITE